MRVRSVKATLLTILMATLSSACVAVWGSSYNVALSNSRSVVIEYDPVVVSMPALLQAAQEACDHYGKDAVLDSVDRSNLGIRVNTYRCESRNPDQVIDVQG